MALRIDFLKTRREPPLGWALLVVGAMSAVAAYHVVGEREAGRTALEARVQQQVQAQELAQDGARQPRVQSTAERRAAAARSLLQEPWLPALHAVEVAASDPIFLLSLRADARDGSFKLEGEAPDFDSAVTFAQRLSDEGSLLPAILLSHDLANDPVTGRTVIRFTATTQWVTH